MSNKIEAIRVENLKKEFGKTAALKNIGFSVKQGEVFGYLGPNGAGKTTTMRILLGLLRPTAGYAEVLGHDVNEDLLEIRKRIGVLLEDPGLYEYLSAYDNLAYYDRIYRLPGATREERLRRSLESAGLWDRRNDLAGTFSKGMKQRLAIARALIHNPELLFFDEPTSGLDPEAQRTVRDLILELAGEGGRTVFLNSHNLDEVQRICSKTAILREGEIIACDTPQRLQRSLSHPTVEIALEDTLDTGDKKRIVSDLTSLDIASSCRWDCNKLIVEIMESSRPADLLGFLIQRGVRVDEAKQITKSLEEVYLALVREDKA